MPSETYTFYSDQMPSLCVIDSAGKEHIFGDADKVYELASLTKILTAITTCDLVASGFLDLDENIEDINFTKGKVVLKDLLSHVSGISFNGDVEQIEPQSKRLYSNLGYEIIDNFISKKLENDFGKINIAELFNQGFKHIIAEQSDAHIDFYGSPAYGAKANLSAIYALLRQMRNPTFIDPEMHKLMTTTYLENLRGIIPGWGNYVHCAFGLGYEIKSDKSPHWMGSISSSRTFGHFGQSGVFVMHDPESNVSIAALSENKFGQWAKDLWPGYVDEIIESYS